MQDGRRLFSRSQERDSVPVNRSALNELLSHVAAQGRHFVERAWGTGDGPAATTPAKLVADVRALIGSRGEASGTALAATIMARYGALSPPERRQALVALNAAFAPDPARVRAAFTAWDRTGDAAALEALSQAVEPPRQEMIRRLNRAPGNTLHLVRMREDLLAALPEQPELASLDADFVHLFGSWFNRGFLMLRRIDWTTPANILEKIIAYEAVHAIDSWDDLRRRLEPPDRRCFAFFHPALVDEPLVFVEVALTRAIPSDIQSILGQSRAQIAAAEATTAVFYSISNCQTGLARISFGNFLIKQVVEELKRDLPGLSTFVTLSPAPGFRGWLEAEAKRLGDASEAARALADGGDQAEADQRLARLAAQYFTRAKARSRTGAPRPVDPVARFHLGNGARLERINPGADRSAKGQAESLGLMVNYLYDPATIETNHEAFASDGTVAVSTAVRRLAKAA
jgi:malonyl-CoA decarboxylase